MSHRATSPILHRAASAMAVLDRISWTAIVATMAIMTVTVVSQVVLRYVFSAGIDWSEELARLAFVWAMFLAIPHGIRTGVHVGIDVIVARLSVRSRGRMLRLTSGFGVMLMALLLYYAISATLDSWGDNLPTLPLSVGIYYLAVVIAAGHGLLNCLLLMAFGEDALVENTLAEIEEALA